MSSHELYIWLQFWSISSTWVIESKEKPTEKSYAFCYSSLYRNWKWNVLCYLEQFTEIKTKIYCLNKCYWKRWEFAQHFWTMYILLLYIWSRAYFHCVMLLSYLEIPSFQQHHTYALKLSFVFPQPDLNNNKKAK